MANTIPSKQCHRSGTYEQLNALLSDREIGLCTDDGVVYIKDPDRGLSPIHGKEMTDTEVDDVLNILNQQGA